MQNTLAPKPTSEMSELRGPLVKYLSSEPHGKIPELRDLLQGVPRHWTPDNLAKGGVKKITLFLSTFCGHSHEAMLRCIFFEVQSLHPMLYYCGLVLIKPTIIAISMAIAMKQCSDVLFPRCNHWILCCTTIWFSIDETNHHSHLYGHSHEAM